MLTKISYCLQRKVSTNWKNNLFSNTHKPSLGWQESPKCRIALATHLQIVRTVEISTYLGLAEEEWFCIFFRSNYFLKLFSFSNFHFLILHMKLFILILQIVVINFNISIIIFFDFINFSLNYLILIFNHYYSIFHFFKNYLLNL